MKLILSAVHVVLGALLIALSTAITNASANVKLSDDIARANQGIYTIGIVLVVLGVAVQLLADDAAIEGLAGQNNVRNALIGLVAVIGVVLVVLSGIVVNKTSGNARNYAIGALVVGVVLLLLGGGLLAWHNRPASKLAGAFMFDSSDSEQSSVEDSSSEASNDMAFRCY